MRVGAQMATCAVTVAGWGRSQASHPRRSHVLEGTFAITTDRYADALADFERAVALDQDYDVAQRNLEVARQRRDDVQGSIEARADMITRHHSFQMLSDSAIV